MSPVRFGLYTLLGTAPFVAAWVWAGIVLGDHWATISADLQPFNYAIVALVVAGVIYVVLLAMGAVTPGWPPRRPSRAVGGTAPPVTSGSAPGARP